MDSNKVLNHKYLIGLSLIPLLGLKSTTKLLSYFKSAENIWNSSDKEIQKVGLQKNIIESFLKNRKLIDIEEEYLAIVNKGVRVLAIDDKEYPSLLREIFDPPVLLYYKGEIDFRSSLFFGVVGTRKITSYGKRAIEGIVGELARKGLIIVSGMAIGGDTKAHRAAIENNGKTVAVLGSGFNNIYPKNNEKLALEIIHNGCLISEYHPSIEPRKFNFPMRNRIISGMSVGLLVVEASEKSGTLITANCALDQNREVFALPGSIFSPYSKGPAKLIKMGAKMVTSVDDIFEELQIETMMESKRAEAVLPDSNEEKRIQAVLNLHDYVMIDELIRALKMSSSEILATLTMMEMKGMVRNLGAGKYSKK